MKKQVLLLLLLVVSPFARAQTQKGNGILSGELAVDYSQQLVPGASPTTASKTTAWTPVVALTAGRFWADNWLAGVSLSGSATFTRQYYDTYLNPIYPANGVSVSVTPFVRRYWQWNSILLFAGVGVSVGISDTRRSSLDSNGQVVKFSSQSSAFAVNPRLEVGATYFLTNRLGLQLVAGAISLPLNTASLSAGLVYWTGADRRAEPQEERTNWQTEPGRWVLEGNFSVATQKDKQAGDLNSPAYQATNSTYSFSPSVGFFVKKNRLLGVSIPVAYIENKSTTAGMSATDQNYWTIGISPYYQHYWTSTRLTPYTRVNVGYVRYTAPSLKASQINGGLTIGLAYMAGQRFIIETSLANASVDYFRTDEVNGSDRSTSWQAGLSAGFAGNFVVRYVLP